MSLSMAVVVRANPLNLLSRAEKETKGEAAAGELLESHRRPHHHHHHDDHHRRVLV